MARYRAISSRNKERIRINKKNFIKMSKDTPRISGQKFKQFVVNYHTSFINRIYYLKVTLKSVLYVVKVSYKLLLLTVQT